MKKTGKKNAEVRPIPAHSAILYYVINKFAKVFVNTKEDSTSAAARATTSPRLAVATLIRRLSASDVLGILALAGFNAWLWLKIVSLY